MLRFAAVIAAVLFLGTTAYSRTITDMAGKKATVPSRQTS